MSKSISFIDLAKQQKRLKKPIQESIKKVLDHGQYIMGPEVNELEDKLALFTGASYVATCASGTDAVTDAVGLLVVLMQYL